MTRIEELSEAAAQWRAALHNVVRNDSRLRKARADLSSAIVAEKAARAVYDGMLSELELGSGPHKEGEKNDPDEQR